MGVLENTLQSGRSAREISMVLRDADDEFSRNIAIEYSRTYGKAFISCFIKYKSVRMAAGFACKWFEREFSEILETAPDFGEFVSRQRLSERDKELLKRTFRMIFILKQ